MSTTASESDPFFQLLSEALRAGPGSEQWTEAVNKLRDGGVEGADEYRLIIRAREDLEKGRDFRRVSAGPKFTRKVLDAVEEEGRRRSGVPTATIVAVISAIVIIGVIATIIVMMRGGGGYDPQQVAIEQLEKATFSTTAASVEFRGAVPEGWRTIGSLPVDVSNGLTSNAPATEVKGFAGGGAVWSTPLSAETPVNVEANLAIAAAASTTAMHVFVSDSSEFSSDRATSPREVVLIVQAGRVSADVNGQLHGESAQVTQTGQGKAVIRLSGDATVIELDGKRIYAGSHNLQPGSPRYVGVRFIRGAGDTTPTSAVKSIEISQAGTK